MSDKRIERALEQVFDAVRSLSPTETHQLFANLAKATEGIAGKYDRELADLICGQGYP